MKSLFYTFLAAALCAWLASPQAAAQEAEFKTAEALEEKQTAGISKLADKIQNFGFLDYARKLVDRLDKKERKIDPFGMPMDPQQKGAETAFAMEAPGDLDAVKTTLEEAVSKFRVTGIYPKRGEVIVGAQSLRVGDHIIIKHRDVSFHLKLSKVMTDSVELVDTETGEAAGVTLGIVQSIPNGMTRKQPTLLAKPGAANKSGSIVPMGRRQLTLDLSPKPNLDSGPGFRQK